MHALINENKNSCHFNWFMVEVEHALLYLHLSPGKLGNRRVQIVHIMVKFFWNGRKVPCLRVYALLEIIFCPLHS